MATVLQLLHQCGADHAGFKLGTDIATAEVGQTDCVLRVQFPVRQANDRLVDVLDDLRAARGTHRGNQFAAFAIEHQSRGH